MARRGAEEKLVSPRPRPVPSRLSTLPPRIPPAHYKKLWPNMAPPPSDVPFFLQRAPPEKVLNYGVFDWRRLERSRPLSFDFSAVGSSAEPSTRTPPSAFDRPSLLLLPKGCSAAARRSLSGPIGEPRRRPASDPDPTFLRTIHDSRRFSFGSSSSCDDSPRFLRSRPSDDRRTSQMDRCSSLSDSGDRRRRAGSPFRRFLDPILRPSKASPPPSPARTPVYLGGAQRKALLRVSWKDGVPLFTFAPSEGEVLAATGKEVGEGPVYTLYCVLKGRKVSGGWMTQGRRRELISNVVGRMEVLRRGDDAEFVLVGPDGCRSSELAAVVVRDGGEVAALLPGEVHGRAAGGEKPATLVERWRSGGRCDCGGWDAGCPLTVLRAQPPAKAGGARRLIELFSSGGRGGGAALSVAGSKEGVYDVEFDGSITELQALAVCVAVLHGRRQGDAGEPVGSRPRSTAAYRPPPSPVCRA